MNLLEILKSPVILKTIQIQRTEHPAVYGNLHTFKRSSANSENCVNQKLISMLKHLSGASNFNHQLMLNKMC